MGSTQESVASGTRKARAKSGNGRKHRKSASTKVDQARSLFNKMDGAARRDVVAAFVKDVGLTASGASTYYQKFLSEAKSSGKAIASRPRGRPTDESSKAGMARAMFKKLAGKPRKEVIEQFVSKLKLTPAGAATYYQSLKKAA